MKKILRFSLTLLATLFASANIMAQTDVTSQYIKNANFDVEGDWLTQGNVAINPASPGTVTEWTSASSTGWNGSAVFKIGSAATMNNATVPALNAAGAAEGGTFACAASWMSKAQYTQDVTLPAGTYVLSFDAYEGNASVQASGIDKYLIGFIADDGTEYLTKKETYTVGEWTSHEIKFTLLEETTGKMSIGYLSGNVTSNNTPKIFIDNLKLTQSEIAYPVDLTGKAINRHNGWTKLASVGAINNYSTDYAEFYNAQHVTGDIMQQVIKVPNGKYNVEYRFNANCANWECTPIVEADGQEGYSVMYVNGVEKSTKIKNSKSLDADQPYVYTLENIEVTDGTLTFKVANLKEAANWLTVSISKIELQKPEAATTAPVVSITEDGDEITVSSTSADAALYYLCKPMSWLDEGETPELVLQAEIEGMGMMIDSEDTWELYDHMGLKPAPKTFTIADYQEMYAGEEMFIVAANVGWDGEKIAVISNIAKVNFTVGTASSIKTVNTVANKNVMFNLAGQRVNNAKGIVIINGKKALVK